MQISSTTISNSSLNIVAKEIAKDINSDINGAPDFLLIALTSGYKKQQDYNKAINYIIDETGAKNVIGGTFPAVSTNGQPPTIQGGSALAFKDNEIQISKPIDHKNIRVNQKGAISKLSKIYNKKASKNKIAFGFSPGPVLLPNAMEQLKLLDSYPALKFKKMFNFLGDQLEKFLGRKGLGAGGYIDAIIQGMALNGVHEMIGGATFNINLEQNYQFAGKRIFSNSFVGTILSSSRYKFNHNWYFDKSTQSKRYNITKILNSGYIQEINTKPANEELLKIMGIPREIYIDAFETFAYGNALYLSVIREQDETYRTFLTANHPKLDGVISTIPKSWIKNKKEIIANLYTQSGEGIKRSARECANKIKQGHSHTKFGIFINCANRLLIAGDKIYEENKEISNVLGYDVPFISLYSGSEFSIIKGQPIYSSVTIHGLVVGE